MLWSPALTDTSHTAEGRRLADDARRVANWKRWGPYLSERQWGTVREDYSAGGSAWEHFPHDHARSRAYRWGEDGLLGITDRECRLAFALALWNGKDPFLKERLFGLTNPQGAVSATPSSRSPTRAPSPAATRTSSRSTRRRGRTTSEHRARRDPRPRHGGPCAGRRGAR
jgi:hypothetical protein